MSISKAERTRRKREKIKRIYQYYLDRLVEVYQIKDYCKIRETYSSITAFEKGVRAMCDGGEHAYWHREFNNMFKAIIPKLKEADNDS